MNRLRVWQFPRYKFLILDTFHPDTLYYTGCSLACVAGTQYCRIQKAEGNVFLIHKISFLWCGSKFIYLQIHFQVKLWVFLPQTNKLRDFSPQANYTDRATAACRRSLVPTFADRGCRVVSATDPRGRNFNFLDRVFLPQKCKFNVSSLLSSGNIISLKSSIYGFSVIKTMKEFTVYNNMCWRARGSVVGWGTMLQAGSSRVLFPLRSLDFF
jgi:hypothetical protein